MRGKFIVPKKLNCKGSGLKLYLVLVLGSNLLLSGFAFISEGKIASAQEVNFANPTFQAAWEQYDAPVLNGQVNRPYLWGTTGMIMSEAYKEAKGGKREVQYFAKGRMELTYPVSQPDFIGDGRIVLEMVTGRVQIGDNSFVQFTGNEAPVAGSDLFSNNPGAPSFLAFQSLLKAQLSQPGAPVTAVLSTPENEGLFLGFASANRDLTLGSLAKNAFYVPETGHNVPDIFWNYLNQQDPDGFPLFSWQNIFGLPITDPYWCKVRDNGGNPQDVMVQLFERRTLLYNPASRPGLQVESGNAGYEYYRWRYLLPELAPLELNVEQSSGPGTVQPAVSEAGAVFSLKGWNFLPNEPASAWIERQTVSAGPNAGRGVFEQKVSIRPDGSFNLLVTTTPLFSPSRLYRLVVIGKDSGNRVVLNFRVVNSLRYTPGYEAVQPNDTPPNVTSSLDNNVIPVGGTARLNANGFIPSEKVKVTLTTPLNLIINWNNLINRTSSPGSFNRILAADKDGTWKSLIPGPGIPEPGLYTLTVVGLKSGKISSAYFRTRAGLTSRFNPFYSLTSFLAQNSALKAVDFSNLPLDPHLYDDPSATQIEQNLNAGNGEGE